jgi:hypothetical protein
MSLSRALPEFSILRLHEVNIYPTDPWRDGKAFIEYVVLNKVFGDFDIEK